MPLFLGPKLHANYDFPTPCGPTHLPINCRNFTQSPFKGLSMALEFVLEKLES